MDLRPPLQMIHQDTTMVYNEVDALSTLLGYQVQNAGCCKVVFHPTWGSAVYPSTLFAIAPMEEVRAFEHSEETDTQMHRPRRSRHHHHHYP